MGSPSNALNISQPGLVRFDGVNLFTGVTVNNHNLLIGAASNGISSVTPSATLGVPVISQGTLTDPTFGTALVPGGGTGQPSLTLHGILIGSGTNPITSVGPSSTAGQVFQSGGASSDPLFSTATYPSTATGTGTILRADGTNWVATTATYPTTTTINRILYSSSNNVVSEITTANSAQMVTSAAGVPSMTTAAGNILNTTKTSGLVYLSGNVTNVTGDNTSYVVAYDSAQYDQGSNFNTSTFTLTFPVTGTYILNCCLSVTSIGVAHTDLFAKFNLPSVSAFWVELNPSTVAGTTATRFNGTLIWRATAADTCTIIFNVNGSTKTIGLLGTNTNLGTWFSWNFLG